MQRSVIRVNRSLQRASLSTNAANLKCGFIGVGNMGGHMANHIGAHHYLTVFDLSPANVSAVANAKVAAPTVKDLASTSNVIITMLPNTKHVEETLLGDNGVFANAPRGSMIIDCSTIDPSASRALAEKAEEAGHVFLDAPVSGGVKGAANATLTFMVGGKDKDVEAARPILSLMGKNIVHCGDVGTGEITKLCNNLALAISMIGTSEALALGVRMGMDGKVLAGVMNTSTARCWSSEINNPFPGVLPDAPASRGYTGGFGTALMTKDLTLAMKAASDAKVVLPLGTEAHQLYSSLCDEGMGGLDFSSVYKYLMEAADKK